MTIYLDSWHYTNHLWSADHVMNLNIKKVIDIFSVILRVMGQIFDFEISTSTAKLFRRQANKWKITSSNPTNHQEWKNLFIQYGGLYMGVYILVSTHKLKSGDFIFYNVLTLWKFAFKYFLRRFKILIFWNHTFSRFFIVEVTEMS